MKHLKTFESFSPINEEEAFWKKKMSPDEAIKAGEENVKKNPGKLKVYSMFAKQGDKEKSRKFLMYVGYNPNVKYPKWDAEEKAPDETVGYFIDGTKYSGQGSGGRTGLAA
jgi:hypothetical protein